MTFYRENKIGIGSIHDYRILNSMSLNDRINKNIADSNSKGIIAWKKIDKTTLRQEAQNPSTITFSAIPGMKDLKFSVEKNRFINFLFYPLSVDLDYITPPASAGDSQDIELQISFSIDNAMSGTLADPQNSYAQRPSSINEGPTTFSPTHTSALSAGEHTVSVMFKFLDEALTGATAQLNDGALFIVEDLGERIITPVIVA